jgi:NAD(P)-dependent dehydrogenase (short-subunit alcohol dehydrogenase family)
MTKEEIESCLKVLARLNTETCALDEIEEDLRIALMREAGRLTRPNKLEMIQKNRENMRARRRKAIAADKKTRAATGIREARRQTVFVAPARIEGEISAPVSRLEKARMCYVCKADFHEVHHFYDAMCAACGDFNYKKRFQTANLEGQVALITGSRLKIGYQSALMMLRAGARVIATTRFPVDAAERFAREEDFRKWGDRLEVYGLDLRHIPSVELFCRHIERRFDRLDILINNAAQTVRRPAGFYSHLMERERLRPDQLSPEVNRLLGAHQECKQSLTGLAPLTVSWNQPSPGVGLLASAELSQIPYACDGGIKAEEVFPEGRLDADLQQVDLRKMNSWRMTLQDVPTAEMLEVQLVNSVAPFVLCSRLAPLMRRHKTGMKHIVNVSAMEGKFSRFTKTDKHPHTNMAKAALNMLTLTSAPDLAKDGIYMNAVDTGWVTDEDPMDLSLAKQEMHDFEPPLDIVDGAARVCDPFFDGIQTGKHWSGQFLKDYFPTEW